MYDFSLPKIPLGAGIEATLDWLTLILSPLTRAFAEIVEIGIDAIVGGLGLIPPVILAVLIALLSWKLATRGIAIFAVIGLLFVWNIGLWDAMLSTIALVLMSTVIAVAMGVPLGIIAGLSEKFHAFVKPILDFMQTMPAFVYLIPAIPFFGLGPVAAAFATVIFSIPPAIRLTALGIRQIDSEMIEASEAFVCSTARCEAGAFVVS